MSYTLPLLKLSISRQPLSLPGRRKVQPVNNLTNTALQL